MLLIATASVFVDPSPSLAPPLSCSSMCHRLCMLLAVAMSMSLPDSEGEGVGDRCRREREPLATSLGHWHGQSESASFCVLWAHLHFLYNS